MKVNFKQINVEINFEGDIVEVDARKELANAIHRTTNDIGFDDFAREMYYSEDEIDVPDEYIQPIMNVAAACLIVPVQRALKQIFEQDKK